MFRKNIATAGLISVACAACCLTQASIACGATRPAARVLFIGIDGCRTDALRSGQLPNLQSLIQHGAFSDATNILGSRGDAADTVSGPGWSNLLTGVWPDKHGVMDNKFKVMHYGRFPHFFKHVKQAFPEARTCSYCTWGPIQDRILSSADVSEFFDGEDKKVGYPKADARCADAAVDMLRKGDPDAVFVYLGEVDEAGHAKGFHPTVPDYKEALQAVDGEIGQIITALHARPNFEAEHWLVLVGTDHGGKGTGHGGGRKTPEINTVWLIVSGNGAASGSIEGVTNQVDLVATALTHLGIALRPEWQFDGRAVGLKATAAAK
jgi:predicted AlkP superfamily pyrophosphatase or phosphodiesterase